MRTRFLAAGLGGLAVSALSLAADATLSEVMVMAPDPQASEAGADAASFFLARNGGNLEVPLVISFTLTGSAANGKDYTSVPLTVSMAPNQPIATIDIKPLADSETEGAETVVLTLAEKKGTYLLSKGRSARATITDGPPPAPALPPADRTGTLTVSVTFDGTGRWAHPTNGAYANQKVHRAFTYEMPLRGTYSAASSFTDIDRRESRGPMTMMNLKRYLVLQPRDILAPVGRVCGRGQSEILDISNGMETGDPGQPPLVPVELVLRGGGNFPSGDKTVPERDLCEAMIALDLEKNVYHLRIDGSDSHVKVRSVLNGREIPAAHNVQLQGGGGNVKAKLFLTDLPLTPNAKVLEGRRVIENFSTTTGRGGSRVPLTAVVKWKITLQ